MILAPSITPRVPHFTPRAGRWSRVRAAVAALLGGAARLRHRAAGATNGAQPLDQLLAGGDVWASDALGLDGAPSMVFRGAMPAYSPAIDRPAPSNP
ncbi:MAG TPA: hypothetical protein VML58_12000 [Burkholderiaceae bacterium]|nr:hypothetical protein [Burkholderiaceae bacterium]